MTHIFSPNPNEMSKWRVQADKAAAHLKKTALAKEQIHIGFAFDDGVITVRVLADKIRSTEEKKLADYLYNLVLMAAQTGGSA